MNLSDDELSRLKSSLSQISSEFDQVLKDGVDSSQAENAVNNYKEIRRFLNDLALPNQGLKERIEALPILQEPNYVLEKVIFLNTGIIGLLNPYLLIIILTITAPISIPLLIWKRIWTNKQKEKIRIISQSLSSLKFMIEYPNYFSEQNK